jgi:antitoxin component YwqK of YwqJK toxin-antitoxin module
MKYLITLIILFSCTFTNAKRIKIIPETRTVLLREKDSYVEASIFLDKNKRVKTEREKFYYWYGFNAIHVNEGNYSGQLIHGDYSVYDNEHNLLENGRFDFGLKDGVWLSWAADGTVESEIEWNIGEKEGIAKYYKGGVLQREEIYKNNLLHGKTIEYIDGGKPTTVRYKRGELIGTGWWKGFWKRYKARRATRKSEKEKAPKKNRNQSKKKAGKGDIEKIEK